MRRASAPIRRIAGLVAALVAASAVAASPPPILPPGHDLPPTALRAGHGRSLEGAPQPERDAIDALLASAVWPRRALALLRLSRYDCPPSRERLEPRLDDAAWQVRCFAALALALRGQVDAIDRGSQEEDPRVVRALLRCGVAVPEERLVRGIVALHRIGTPEAQLLGVELAAAAESESLRAAALERLGEIVLRLDRTTAGLLGERLELLTGAPPLATPHRWRDWFRRHRQGLLLRGGGLDDDVVLPAVARLEPAQFVELAAQWHARFERPAEIGVALDSTGSMGAVFTRSRQWIQRLAELAGQIAAPDAVRLGLVAYRDRRDPDFETRTLALVPSRERFGAALWSLSVDGGGDGPEAVLAAIQEALASLAWSAEAQRILVILGDAPPHPGTGGRCVELLERARAIGLTAHTVQAQLGRDRAGNRTRTIDAFPEIAAAGGGRCVELGAADELLGEIVGLGDGEQFAEVRAEFVRIWARLCRE